MSLGNELSEKWKYQEHTKAKHRILEKYLQPWIQHLGKCGKICYFDGFAGPGEYEDGSVGSPIIAIRRAKELQKNFDEFIFFFVDKNPDYCKNLKKLAQYESEDCPKIKVFVENGEFRDVVSHVLDQTKTLAPSFFFIDPFGYSGVPFRLVKKILSFPKTEIFLNFMYHDINRFLRASHARSALEELFGCDMELILTQVNEGKKKEDNPRELYRSQLFNEANVKYTMAYKVRMSTARRTRYYLFHATNHFKGFKIMKDIMYREGMSGVFEFLGPDEAPEGEKQLSLYDFGALRFGEFLLKKFAGRKISFDDILEESYTETPLIEKHYRKKLKVLEKRGQIKVNRVTSKTSRGLQGKDLIIFS